jgi:acetyl esterase/lipase
VDDPTVTLIGQMKVAVLSNANCTCAMWRCLICLIISGAAARESNSYRTIALWPDLKVETTRGTDRIEERGTTTRPNRMMRDIRHAQLTVCPAPADKANGAAIIICPGGAYAGESIDKEGFEIARWLNSIGVTGTVLQYRLPRPEVTRDATPLPLLDAREAVRVVRARAKEWQIDPHRVGIMGFSAGGHLASTAITHLQPPSANSRPDFAILGYPVISFKDPLAHGGSRRNLVGDNPSPDMIDLYSNELHVTADTPPTFIFHAKDDKGVPIGNSRVFYAALQKVGVPAELHEFEQGGHGFGLGTGESAQWTKLCEEWMKERGILMVKP